MPLLYIVGIAVSIPLIIHCIRTGRNTVWVFVMLSLPLIGSAAYFFVEIFPELRSSRTSQRAMRGLRNTLNPEGSLRQAENAMKVSGTVAARQKYADELVRMGRAAEAVPIYQNCLTGVFAEDPKLLLGYAHAQFAAGDPAAARAHARRIDPQEPGIPLARRAPAVRACPRGRGKRREGVIRVCDAGRVLPGAEAGVRYAKLLKRLGQGPLARQTLQALLERARPGSGPLSQGPARLAGRGRERVALVNASC
jgi:hypothetical protein